MSPSHRKFRVYRLPDGRAMVNLGSSARTAAGWTNIDSSLILRMAGHPRLSRFLWKVGLIGDDRYARIQNVSGGCVVWNLVNGVPYPDETFDVVYHSHLLEHIERDQAPAFLSECFRVLKRGGVIRVVVPDLEQLGRAYVRALDGPSDPAANPEYEAALVKMFEQMVLRVPPLRRSRPWIVRVLETMLIGDLARSGTLHRWMYDRFSLASLLRKAGFAEVTTLDHRRSRIPGWESFALDVEPDGTRYKVRSIYLEARRP